MEGRKKSLFIEFSIKADSPTFYPRWMEGGAVPSSLEKSCQCTDSQIFQDIYGLFGGEVLRSLKQMLTTCNTLI